MTGTVLTANEYHFRLRQKVDALKARVNNTPYLAPEKEQGKILLYFANRAIQIGEACFRVDNLETPLFILARVLCEDFIVMFWVSQSETNASEYSKKANSELIRMMRTNLINKRARIRHKKTGEDVTAKFLPELDGFITGKKYLEEIARQSGLEKLYDIVYRYDSLEVHGNTFGISEPNTVAVAISAVNAILNVILEVLHATENPLKAGQVLTMLNMQRMPGS